MTVGVGLSVTLLSAFWNLISLLGCLAQPWYEGLYLVLLYLVLCSVNISRMPALFCGEMRWGGISGEEGRLEWSQLEGVEGEEAVVGMYCMREE